MKNFTRFLSASLQIYFLFISVCFLNVTKAQTTWTILSSPNNPNKYTASSFINDDEGWLIDNTTVLWHTSDGCALLTAFLQVILF